METTTTPAHELNQEYRSIPLAQIRDPQQPARETMDEVRFAELVDSIKAVGLIEPIIVKDCGTDFEVVAGHRRTMACRAAGLQDVPCMIRRNKTVSNIAVMIHENAFREDMNPIQEARFYAQAMEEEADNDVDKLCAMLKRDRAHVEGRLLLLFGHKPVVDALEAGRISIAAARALNKLTNVGVLPMLLDSAMNQGATARQVTEWVREYDGMPPIAVTQSAAADTADAAGTAQPSSVPTCQFCRQQKHAHMMRMVWFHEYCLDGLDGLMNGHQHGAA